MKTSVGDRGEDIAVRFLKKKGYKIIERNYRTPIGEIDVIAGDKKTLVFVEVKTRLCDSFGYPEEAVDYRKKKKIEKVALYYLSKIKQEVPSRFDVISIRLTPDNKEEIEHFTNAFELT